jgi:N-methylhydantoinase A
LVTIQRGHDPRDLTLVASGGGGPMHAATLGRELGVKRIVVPRHAGLFSAWGMLAARPRIDLHRTRLARLRPETFAHVDEAFAELRAEAAAIFSASPESLIYACSIEMRYSGQEHAIATRLDPGAGFGELLAAFHAAHERAYTFRLDDTPVELVTYHLAAEIDAPQIGMPEIAASGDPQAAWLRARELSEGGAEAPASVYDRDRLPAGTVLRGPVLIEEPTTTTLVLESQTVTVDRHGLLIIEEVR